jgi:hypothetical protein
MATVKTETKTVTRWYAVLKEDFTYEFYGRHVIEAGRHYNLRNYTLTKGGLVFILGHGAAEVIPMDKLELVEETDEVVTTTTRTRAPYVPVWREPARRGRKAKAAAATA